MRDALAMHAKAPVFTGFRLGVSVYSNGRARSLSVGPKIVVAATALLLLLAGWALAAGIYVCFHDALLASLMARQTEMQYGYEDQIAGLRTALDRESSRNLIDRHTIEGSLHDLAARAAQLEGHSATLDRLIGEGTIELPAPRASTGARPRGSTPPPAPIGVDHGGQGSDAAPTGLRLDADHAGLAIDTLDKRLARVETVQRDAVVRLRDPLIGDTRRLAAALADVGLLKRLKSTAAAGGPFVPLPGDAGRTSFDDQIALVADAIEQHSRLAAIVDRVPLRKPMSGPLDVTSGFGARLDPFLGRPAMHTGIDLRDSLGDAVRATAAGVVTVAGRSGGYGDMVEIDHGDGLVTRYAHLSAIDVVPHQRVATGTIVGRVGSTGRATGPHLHYETRIDGEPVDPTRFLSAGAVLAKD